MKKLLLFVLIAVAGGCRGSEVVADDLVEVEGQFLEALQQGDLVAVLRFFNNGLNVNHAFSDNEDGPPLYEAVDGEVSWSELVELLIMRGAEIDSRDGDFRTPLFIAARCGNTQIAKMLLDNKADVNASDRFRTILMEASSTYWSKDLVALLLEHKADVNAQNYLKETALMCVSQFCPENYEEGDNIIELLLKHKATVNNRRHIDGITALMMGVCMSDRSYKLLLESKADVNLQDNNGGTALMFAVAAHASRSVQLLLEHKAAINIQDNIGRTAIDHIHGRHDSIEKLLRTHGARSWQELHDEHEAEQKKRVSSLSAESAAAVSSALAAPQQPSYAEDPLLKALSGW